MRMWGGRAKAVLSGGVLAGLLLFGEGQAQAAVFFDDSFETTLMPNWTTGSCQYLGFAAGSQPVDGCNPTRSKDMAHSGSYSLKGSYFPSPCPGGDGTGSCGVWIDRQHPATDEVYTRYYYRTAGFTYNSVGGGTKHFYHRSNSYSSPEPFFINMWGSREMNAQVTVVAGACNGHVYDSCNYYNNESSVPLNDDRWYCVETHVKLNTPGVANGVMEIWVDGVRTMNVTGQEFRGPTPNGTNGNSSLFTFNFVRIYVQLGKGYMYYDDFAVGNTRIGCTAGSAPQDATPPASPTGLILR